MVPYLSLDLATILVSRVKYVFLQVFAGSTVRWLTADEPFCINIHTDSLTDISSALFSLNPLPYMFKSLRSKLFYDAMGELLYFQEHKLNNWISFNIF